MLVQLQNMEIFHNPLKKPNQVPTLRIRYWTNYINHSDRLVPTYDYNYYHTSGAAAEKPTGKTKTLNLSFNSSSLLIPLETPSTQVQALRRW